MSKGKQAAIGTENVSANGYTYVKTSTGWLLKHWVIMQEAIGRPIDRKTERVSFKDNDRTNFAKDNIILSKKNVPANALHKRVDRIEEMMTNLVEDHPDKSEALNALRDALSEVRLTFGFAKL